MLSNTRQRLGIGLLMAGALALPAAHGTCFAQAASELRTQHSDSRGRGGVAIDVDFDNPQLSTLSKSKGWFDPIVGARLWFPVSSSLDVILRGDVGGFGVGSDLTWQLSGHLRYAFSDSFSGLLGYRYFYMDYESGEGLNRFVYDMAIHGPTLGLSWGF